MRRPDKRFAISGLLLALLGCGSDLPGHSSSRDTTTPTTVIEPPPAVVVDSVSPSHAPAGSSDLTITVIGKNFDGEGHLRDYLGWAASGHRTLLAQTRFVSATELTAVVPAALLASSVVAQIYVEHVDLMGDRPGGRTNSVSFTVE